MMITNPASPPNPRNTRPLHSPPQPPELGGGAGVGGAGGALLLLAPCTVMMPQAMRSPLESWTTTAWPAAAAIGKPLLRGCKE